MLSITGCRHAPTAEAKSPTATPVSNEPLRPEALMDQAAADAMLANLEKSEATLRGPAPEPVFERLEKDHGRPSALLKGIIESVPFQKRRAPTAAETRATE